MSDYDLSKLPEDGMRDSAAVKWATNYEVRASNDTPANPRASEFEAAQWVATGPGVYAPSGQSFAHLPPGFYTAISTPNSIYASEQPLVADDLEILPGSCNESVVTGIRKFWNSRELYRKHGLSYKRGVLFYGAPGAGKTATVLLLCKELITRYSGAVFLCREPGLLTELLKKLRRIEPARPLIVVMEDLDEIISSHGEHGILALLDGEEQIDNVVFLASTNYPERLGARIVNRPSRFDERIFVDMPSEMTRRAYLQIVTKSDPLSEKELSQWVLDTNRMSIAHVRELVIAVRCLGHSYEDVIARLKTMATRPRAKEGIGSPMGLTA